MIKKIPKPPRTKKCASCDKDFEAKGNAAKYCPLCKKADPHRHRKRKNAMPQMYVSFDNEAIQEGEGDTAIMWGKCLSWGMENGESDTHFWKWGDDIPYEERGGAGALLYMCNLVAKPYKLKKPWGDHPIGTEVKLVPISFHFNFDAAILLKDLDLAKMELVRKVQRSIETVICRADHDDNSTCDKLHDHDALDEAIIAERDKLARTGAGNPQDDDDDVDFKGILHAYDPDDINAVMIEGGESDLAAWDRRSKVAVAFTPRRRFYAEIRPNGDWYGGWHGKLDVHDTGSAFVGGLEKAIADWNPPISDEQRAAIKWGKQARKNGFGGGTDEQIAAYSEAECVAHALMCRMLIDTVKEVSNVPMALKDLYGSGSVAKAHLDHWDVPKRGLRETSRKRSILDYEEIAQLTYFGGLIHTPLIGRIPVVDTNGNELFVVGQDINSAYPDKFIEAPCMRRTLTEDGGADDCGKWVKTYKSPPKQYLVGHVLASWDISEPDPDGNIIDPDTGERYKSPTSTPPFVVRGKNMGVYHPVMGVRVWVTLVEFREAKRQFGRKIQAHEYLYFEENCVCDNPRPLAHVQKMYDERLSIKTKADHIAGQCKNDGIELTQEFWSLWAKQLTIKLVINSIYGKFGQMRPSPGAYTNLHIASYITGATRAQMRRKIWEVEAIGGVTAYVHTDGYYALGVATDGEAPEEVAARLGMTDEGPDLGKWGSEPANRDMLLSQPGLAYARDKHKKGEWQSGGKVAARGIGTGIWEAAAEGTMAELDLGTLDFTTHPKEWPAIYATDRTMIGLRKARAMGKPHLAGTFQNMEKQLSFFQTEMVDGQIVVPPGQRRDYANAEPVEGIPTLWSVPPITMVSDPATFGDIKQYRTALDKRYRKGDYDTTEGDGK